MRLVLIGNYPKDAQQSMLRFARYHRDGLAATGRFEAVELWEPPTVFGRPFAETWWGRGKWFGYLDKLMLGPLALAAYRRRLPDDTRYHICDHSNAYYRKVLPQGRTTVTCHDVLAIKGALFGDASVRAAARKSGAVLQRFIFGHLLKIKRVACISEATAADLHELHARGSTETELESRVIYNVLRPDFWPVEDFPASLPSRAPYLLHVGSDHPRKNRRLLVEVLALLAADYPDLTACFAGAPLSEENRALARELGVADRVVDSVGPSNEELRRLYSHCAAFVFPSFSEGFGLPLIEAQACGAVVLASELPVLREATGGAALHRDPERPGAFAEAFRTLDAPDVAAELRARGLVNVSRFAPERILEQYADFITGPPASGSSASAIRE